MNTSANLQSSGELPDDFKALIDSAKMSIAAVLDQRLEKITTTTNLLISVDANLSRIHDQLENKPLHVKKQIEEELASPIKTAVDSCRKLDDQMKSLLKRVDQKLNRTQNRLNIALFISGLT